MKFEILMNEGEDKKDFPYELRFDLNKTLISITLVSPYINIGRIIQIYKDKKFKFEAKQK